MSNNITESLFQAISTIAEKHVTNLKYDKTIICTVTDISNAKNNIYTVSDGGTTFEAQGDGGSYRVNDNVRVLILEGDYTKTKYIQGKHNTQEADKPITYVSALNSILDLTDNMVDSTDASKITGITANGSRLEEHIGTINLSSAGYNIANNDIFNTLYIKGEFWSAFDQYEMRSGDYGIHLVIGIDNGEAAGETKRYDRLDLRLSALKDMFGNPYAFKIYTPQEIVCTLSSWPTNAKEIYVYLYQNNNFEYYDYNNQAVQRLTIPYLDKEETTEISNIKVKNVAVGFGSEIASIADNRLKIYTNNTQSFDHRKGANDSYNKKAVQLLWYNKSEDNEYLGFSDGAYVPSPGYDEDTYLAEISTDTRLLTIRDSKNYTKIPHDENCLDLQADINEIIENGQAISKIIGTTLWHTLDNFNDAIAGLSVSYLNDLLGTGDTSLIHYQEQLDKDIEYLHKAYTDILEDAHTHNETFIFKDIDGNACDDIDEATSALNMIHARLGHSTNSETSYYHIINSAITAAEASIQGAITAAASYQDTYDSYVSSLTRTLNKIKKYAEAIHTIYTTPLGTGSDNSTRLAALIKFDADTQINIGEIYGSKLTDDEFVANNANKYCIYWYKKDVSSLTTDGIMPAGWSRIADAKNIGLPDQNLDDPSHYVKKDNSALELTFVNPVRTESIKAVLFYNHEKIISNELIFTNDAEVLTSTEVNLEGEIVIEHGLNSQDTYQVYNEYGDLNNQGDSSKLRKLQVKYKFADEEVPDYLVNTTVYWYVPNNSTLLRIDDIDKTGFSVVASDQTARYKDGYTGYYRTITDVNTDTIFTYHIARNYQNTSTQNHIICEVIKVASVTETEEIVDINGTATNTVTEQEQNVVHSTTQYFNFSAFGNQGTDYTLIFMVQGSQPMVINDIIVDDEHTENALTIVPKLYDFDNKELTLLDTIDDDKSTILTFDGPSDGYDLVVEWEEQDTTTEKFPIKKCKIYKKEIETDESYWGMLKCVANNVQIEGLNKEIDLISYMPIPYAPANTAYIEGASSIMYSAAGNNPVYCKSAYKLYDTNTHNEWQDDDGKKAAWKIRYYKYNDDSTVSYCEGKYDTNAYNFYDSTGAKIENDTTLKAYATSFVPRLDKENCLVASNLFIDDLRIYPVVIAYSGNNSILWAQPLLIRQNKHSSAMLNSWDGSLKVDEESNTILTAMVGAGRKNSNNEFEGVLMGDVATQVGDQSITTLGIYGYNNGAQSFGFKIDGTGFIGKSGKGRILFNGDTSEIKSQRYDTGDGTGMRVDLDNGILDIKKNTKSLIQLNAKDTGYESNPLMYVKTLNDKTLLYIDTNDYYLQSANYNETQGTKFNLQNGHLDAYNFKLTSKNTTINSSQENGTTYFEIRNNDTEQKTLIHASDTGFYLQTADFTNAGTGVKIDLNSGNFKLKTPQIYLGDTPENNYYFKIGNGLTVDNNYNLSVTGDINALSGTFHNVQIYGKNPTNLLETANDQSYTIVCGNFDNPSYNASVFNLAGYRIKNASANTTSIVSGFYEALNGDKTHYPTWCNNYLRMLFTAEPGEELYYRFTIPSTEASDFGLEKGKKYILSGQISLQRYQDSSQSFDTAGNIDYVAVRTQKSKNGSYSGGINKKILEEFTTNVTVDDTSGVTSRNWGEPTFVDFAVDFTIENDAENYYISFQLYPKVAGQNAAACLCLQNLKLYEAGLYGEISPANGFALWKGLKGDGSTSDTNLVFKVDENGAFLKGRIQATAGGTIGGWNIGSNSITTGTLGSANSFHMYSSGSTLLSIGSHFRVDNTGALYASAGNIAGFYINSKDLTIYDNNTDKNVLGFISKGEQPSDGKYAVGSSRLKQNWFIWNKGGTNGSVITETDADSNVTAEGIKGVFGVDMDGNLYATAGSIGNWTISENSLHNTNLFLYGQVENEADSIMEVMGNLDVGHTITSNEIKQEFTITHDTTGYDDDGKISFTFEVTFPEELPWDNAEILKTENMTMIKASLYEMWWEDVAPPPSEPEDDPEDSIEEEGESEVTPASEETQYVPEWKNTYNHTITPTLVVTKDEQAKKFYVTYTTDRKASSEKVYFSYTLTFQYTFSYTTTEQSSLNLKITKYGNLSTKTLYAKQGEIGAWNLGVPHTLYDPIGNENKTALFSRWSYTYLEPADGKKRYLYYYLFPDQLRIKNQNDFDLDVNWLDIARAGFYSRQSQSNLKTSSVIVKVWDNVKSQYASLYFNCGILTDISYSSS